MRGRGHLLSWGLSVAGFNVAGHRLRDRKRIADVRL